MHKVVVGALVREGRVLLVHRSPNKHAYPDVWDLPGGLIEAGESPCQVRLRRHNAAPPDAAATPPAPSRACSLTPVTPVNPRTLPERAHSRLLGHLRDAHDVRRHVLDAG
jgi:hypothetical protein